MFSTHLLHSLAVSLLWIFKTHRMRMAAWKQSKMLTVVQRIMFQIIQYRFLFFTALTDAFPDGLGALSGTTKGTVNVYFSKDMTYVVILVGCSSLHEPSRAWLIGTLCCSLLFLLCFMQYINVFFFLALCAGMGNKALIAVASRTALSISLWPPCSLKGRVPRAHRGAVHSQ